MRVDSIKEFSNFSGINPSQRFTSGFYKKALLSQFKKLEFEHLALFDHTSESLESYSFGCNQSLAKLSAHVDIQDQRAFDLIVTGGSIGAAEAYMQGYWTSPDLLQVLRFFVINLDTLQNLNDSTSWLKQTTFKLLHRLNANNIQGSKRNISAHYDLGNEFFELFLDPSMMYSSAIYQNDKQSLEQASFHKLDTICKKLELQPEHHVVEIGTGWGGFACHAAQHYGCNVTTTTISKKQFERAKQRVRDLQLEDKVTVLFEDYRLLDTSTKYDKLVSIEMIEAVGSEFYDSYFKTCSNLLKDDGQMLIQSILMNDQRYDLARQQMDFIKRYIFPGGCLPSHQVISDHICNHSDLQLMDVHDITYDYAKTLRDWNDRFQEKLELVKEQGYNDLFIRMWEYYLCYCEAGFMERSIHTAQFVWAKPRWRDSRYPG